MGVCCRMSPQPVMETVIGGLVPAKQTQGRKISGELDMDRKQELIMEKKLRACRVSILPKGGGYIEPPPPKKKPQIPTISAESVKKATNPIALRYWNQCNNMEQPPVVVTPNEDVSPHVNDTPPWATQEQPPVKKKDHPAVTVTVPNINVRMGRSGSETRHQVSATNRNRVQSIDRLGTVSCSHHDDPSPMGSPRTEVVRILSTAGTGVYRENEKKEAVGNINRLVTVAMARKGEGDPVWREKQDRAAREAELKSRREQESRQYELLKEEQIQKNQQRANFLGGSEQVRIPKSPRPFSESRPEIKPQTQPTSQMQPESQLQLQSQQQQECSCKEGTNYTATEIPFNTISDLVPKLNQQQTNHLGLTLFGLMSKETVMEVVAQQLSVMSGNHMAAVLGGVSTQATNTAVPLLFPNTSQDVRMSLVADSLSRLSVNQKLDSLLESDEQIPVYVEALLQRLGYKERGLIIRSLVDREENLNTRNHPGIGTALPEIRVDDAEAMVEGSSEEEEKEEQWDWQEGEQLEYEFYEQYEDVSN